FVRTERRAAVIAEGDLAAWDQSELGILPSKAGNLPLLVTALVFLNSLELPRRRQKRGQRPGDELCLRGVKLVPNGKLQELPFHTCPRAYLRFATACEPAVRQTTRGAVGMCANS